MNGQTLYVLQNELYKAKSWGNFVFSIYGQCRFLLRFNFNIISQVNLVLFKEQFNNNKLSGGTMKRKKKQFLLSTHLATVGRGILPFLRGRNLS